MEFRNRTPFPALRFASVDVQDQEHHVVVMRLTYRLQRNVQASTPTCDAFEACVIDTEAPPLVLTDDYAGDPETRSTRQESDLAPFKPRCDVIVNAIAYAPPSSAVTVALAQDAKKATITIRDRGPGVPEELLTSIFAPFYRVDESRELQTGGVGLGLSITSRAIQLHHGSVRAENAKPGLRVLLTLPTA